MITPEDPTPDVGSPTDIARLSHRSPKPPHETTAEDDAGTADWAGIAASEEFRELLRRKARFIVPATVFFIVYYFALPVLVGYAPAFMNRKVLGSVNIAYLFALSQFFMAWALAFIYVAVAAGWDRSAAALLLKFKR